MAEPWMAEIKEHTLSETARSLTAIRDDRRQMRAAEADLIRQNEQLESYGLSREQLMTNRRRLRILQVAMRKKDGELVEARAACDAARARSASRLALQSELGEPDALNNMENEGAGRVGGRGSGQRPEPFVKRALLNVADRESTRLFPLSGVLTNTHQRHVRKVTIQEPEESWPGKTSRTESPGAPHDPTEEKEPEMGGEQGGGGREGSESEPEGDLEDAGVDGEERVRKVRDIQWTTREELLHKMRAPAEAAFGKRVHWANLCEGAWTSRKARAFAKAHPRVPRFNHQVRVPSTAVFTTLHCTVHTTHYTLNSQPSTFPQPSTFNPQPSNFNPES
jgi:hypothetical protein